MTTLITARDISKAFSAGTLFEHVNVHIAEGDRLGFIGPNGAGKSTLLRILAGLENPDSGEVTRRRGLRTAFLEQDDVFPAGATVHETVVAAIPQQPGERLDPATRAAMSLSRLGFENTERPVDVLSGGWRKRLALARSLCLEPHVLFLDEPTNHLDLEGVQWLERFVRQAAMAIVFITHDRVFLENAAHRIIELSQAYPDGTFEVKGNYSSFTRRKHEFLEGQQAAESALANKVRRDTAWLLQGVKARRTRNKTQVDDAAERRADLKATAGRNRAPTKTTTIDFQATERKTKKLIALHNVSKVMGDRTLFAALDLLLSPGDRIGLLGENGSGKTTLLRILAGDLDPDAGTVKRAAELRTVTFSQHRGTLVPTQTLQEALCPVGDMVDFRGRMVHVSGWAQRFLFDVDQLSTYVGKLSGGEQARVLIASLMLTPADILLLDEPTNDLDIPSLEVLEEALMEFPGAIVLVTHDRFMLERLATSFIGLDGRGGAGVYQSIAQWHAARESAEYAAKASHDGNDAKTAQTPPERPKNVSRKKLSYMEQREYDGMEAAILEAEEIVERLERASLDPGLATDHVRAQKVFEDLAAAQASVRALYDRWAELEAKQAPPGNDA